MLGAEECHVPGTLMALVGACVVIGVVMGGARPAEVLRAVRVEGTAVHAAHLSPAAAALQGVWEGVGPADVPRRVVVDPVHPGWAVVHFHWGDHPAGQAQGGWIRVRAKVYPNGTLFWRSPGDFTFRLSADRTTLVGTREQGGQSAAVRMRRS